MKAPVLTGRDEIRMWKNICALEKGAVKKSDKYLVKMDKLIAAIQKSDTDVNPNILGKMMEIADLYGRKNLDSIILGLLGKCKLSDCTLQLKAVQYLLDLEAYDNVRSILDRITIITDIARWEYYRGLVDVHDGNERSALAHFLRAYEFDSSLLDVYSQLDRLDPGKGWMVRRRIESIRAGRSSEGQSSGSVLDDICAAYISARGRDISDAIDTLNRLGGIESGDRDILLAMARVFAEDGSYQRSIGCYEKIAADCSSFSVELELAEVYLKNQQVKEALEVIESLETLCSADRRLMETKIRALVAVRDKERLQKYAEIYLYNDYADQRSYILCIESMIDLSMHTEATRLIATMSVIDPDMPEANLLSSKNEFKAGRCQQALPFVRKAVKKMPDDVDCHLHMSLVCLSLNRYKDARKHADAVLKAEPENLDALVRKKDICKAEGNSAELSELCETILKLNPRDADVLRDLAQVLDSQGKHDEALRRFSESLDIRRDPILFSKIIISLAEQDRHEDAIDIISRYDDMYGDISDTWIVKGNCEYAIGRFYDASDSYKRSLELDHNNSRIWHSKGMADEAAGVLDEAEVSYDKAVLMDLDNKEYWISKASIQEKKGEYAQAIDSFNRVISLHPDNVYALMRKAILLVRLGKITEALFFIDLAHNLSPRDVKIQAVQRDIYFHENENEKCRDMCSKILQIKKDDVDSKIVLARVCMKEGLYGEAIKHLIEISDKYGSSNIMIYEYLRESYHNLGDYEAEMSTCKVMLTIDSDNKDVKLALADVYMKLNRVDAAKKLLNELHDESPNDPELSLRKAKMAVDESVAMKVLLETLAHDPENVDLLMEIANMKLSDGDRDEAFVYLDRAIAADPASSAAYLRKAEVLTAMGEYQQVLDLLNGSMQQFKEQDPVIWEMIGDSQRKLGDNSNALISFDSAIKLGMNTSEMYCKRGIVQEALGMNDAASNSYSLARITDPNNMEAIECSLNLKMTEKKYDAISKEIEDLIAAGTVSGGLLLIRARIQSVKQNKDGLKETLEMCISNDVPDEYTCKVRDILYEMEPLLQNDVPVTDDPHTDLDGEQVFDTVPPVQSPEDRQRDIARYAFLILQISNDTGKAPDDTDVLVESGMPPELKNDVFAYLMDIREYGSIDVGSSEFRRMEELSYRAIIGSNKKDLESEPLISLATAYFQSGADCMDEAKRLVAYIHKSVTMDLVPEYFNNDVSRSVKAIEESSGDITIYAVMKAFKLGVYTARTVKMLSVKGGSSVVDHI